MCRYLGINLKPGNGWIFKKIFKKNLNCNVNTTVTNPIYARIEIVTGFFLVCSIFLRVDRSINEIHKHRALYSIEVYYKKYVFIYY